MKTTGDTLAQSEALMKDLKEFTVMLKMKSTERVDIDVDPLSFY